MGNVHAPVVRDCGVGERELVGASPVGLDRVLRVVLVVQRAVDLQRHLDLQSEGEPS